MRVRIKEDLNWLREPIYAVRVQYLPLTFWFTKTELYTLEAAEKVAQTLINPYIKEFK